MGRSRLVLLASAAVLSCLALGGMGVRAAWLDMQAGAVRRKLAAASVLGQVERRVAAELAKTLQQGDGLAGDGEPRPEQVAHWVRSHDWLSSPFLFAGRRPVLPVPPRGAGGGDVSPLVASYLQRARQVAAGGDRDAALGLARDVVAEAVSDADRLAGRAAEAAFLEPGPALEAWLSVAESARPEQTDSRGVSYRLLASLEAARLAAALGDAARSRELVSGVLQAVEDDAGSGPADWAVAHRAAALLGPDGEAAEAFLADRRGEVAVARRLAADPGLPAEQGGSRWLVRPWGVAVVFGARGAGGNPVSWGAIVTAERLVELAKDDPAVRDAAGLEGLALGTGPAPADVLAQAMVPVDTPLAVVWARLEDAQAVGGGERSRLWAVAGMTLLLAAGAVGAAVTAVRAASREVEAGRQAQRFVHAVGHELRTPLTAIRLHAEILERGGASEEDRRLSLAHIVRESVRLENLVQNVLAAARLDADRSLDLRPVDLRAVAEEARTALQAAGRLHDVDVRVDGARVPASGDGEAALRVVLNLLDNAVKYGGDRVDVDVTGSNGRVSVEVADRGPGVPEGDAGRLFERFWRGEGPSGPGVGLGLAIARELARRMGGELCYTPRPGGGSVFRLDLPAWGDRSA